MTGPRAAGGWDCHVHLFDPGAPCLPGHYEPVAATLEEVEALGAPHGIGHLVLVQPSVYGTDNSVLLQALRASGGCHRGVAVVGADTGRAALAALHAEGVRGVRFNLVSPVGNGCAELERLAPLLRELGWHVQWYVGAEHLRMLTPLQEGTGLVFVLDHLAGITPASGAAEWDALEALAARGAWIKLSGWYRLGCSEPYDQMAAAIERAAALFRDRMVWGSDWPHTSLPPTRDTRHSALLDPVRHALGEARLARVLNDSPARLYGF